MKKLLALLMALCIAASLSGCKEKEPEEEPYAGVPNPIATITLKNGQVMRAELYLTQAPNTVANFIELANSGFYDGQEIFRVVTGAFFQSGDPLNNGTGGPGYQIYGEFSANGYEGNTLSHGRGVISMARASDYDSAGSQFFIMQGFYPEYDGAYAAFGKLLDEESLAVLDSITNMAVDSNHRPLIVTKIETISVDTHGYIFSVLHIGETPTQEPESTSNSTQMPTSEPIQGSDPTQEPESIIE